MFSQHAASRHVGRLTVAILVAVYFMEWYIYNLVCRPNLGWAILFNIIFALALWSYLRAACTDPGTPDSPEWKTWTLTSVGTADATTNSRREGESEAQSRKRGWAPGETTKCDVCCKSRPERAHHCSLCGVCILRMDHHCPWVGTCIGWRNHKFFILLNWWAALACITWLTTLRGPNAFEALNVLELNSHASMVPMVGVIVTMVLFIVTAGMGVYSLIMAARNVSSIEEMFQGTNPYSYSSCFDNLQQLLGPLDYKLLLPLMPTRRGDGTTFPLVGLSDSQPQPQVPPQVPSTDITHSAVRSSRYGSSGGV